MILSEVIERIKTEAVMLAPNKQDIQLLDTEVIIEVILPRVIDITYEKLSKEKDAIVSLTKDHTLTFTNGVATFPTTIKEQWVASFFFPEKPFASYEPRYEEFILTGNSGLVDTFTIRDGNIYFCEVGDDVLSYNGTLTMNAITLPTLPSLISSTVVIKDNILEKIILLAAAIVNGSIALREINA